MHPIHSSANYLVPIFDVNTLDPEISHIEHQMIAPKMEKYELDKMEKKTKIEAKIWKIAALVSTVAIVLIAVITSFINPFCALILPCSFLSLGALHLVYAKSKESHNYRLKSLSLSKSIDRLKNEVRQLKSFKADLKTPYFQNYAKKREIGALSYNDYLEIPQQIRDFASSYPNYIPKQNPNPFPQTFHFDLLLSMNICPITQEPIQDPVEDPKTKILYERSAAFSWIEEHSGLPFSNGTYLQERPNIRAEISKYSLHLYEKNPNIKKPTESPLFLAPSNARKAWSDKELKEYVCPISQEIPRNPVEDPTNDGITLYEKSFIEVWLRQHNSSPITKEILYNYQLIKRPDLAARVGQMVPLPVPEIDVSLSGRQRASVTGGLGRLRFFPFS